MNLKEIYKKLPDSVRYKGKLFTMSFYSLKGLNNGRSKEIIYNDANGNEIYIHNDYIEYIKRGR